jgi:hypothetical protein
MKITATQLNKTPGAYLTRAAEEPVIVERSGHSLVVIVSYTQFSKLKDAFWGEQAIKADEGKTIEPKETVSL